MTKMHPSKALIVSPPKAPPIKGILGDGSTYNAGADKGLWTVLYFYPKDMTSGCTVQAEAFQKDLAAFTALGVKIIGVSRDSCKRHTQFAAKHGLTFPLIADEQGALCEAFGVWIEKKLYGRSYMGIDRSTFVISPTGEIVAQWRGVKVPGHVEEVLALVSSLIAPKH